MLIGNNRYNRYSWISRTEETLICAFMQGAVYAWCNVHGSEPFAARNLVGGDNFYWQGTPLYLLYEHYHNLYPNDDSGYAVMQAGRALGHILKRVIVEDKRTFTTEIRNQVRHYQWQPNEEDDQVMHVPVWMRGER